MKGSLRTSLRAALARAADPKRAEGARAYMKSAMPFYGVGAVPLRKICKAAFEQYPFVTEESWRRAALELWRKAEFREERYVAIELTGAKRYEPFQNLAALPMYEEMIVDGAWWDYVDAIAIHRVGKYLLRRHPREMRKTLLRWSRDENLWRRRTSILAQITFKRETDLEFLYRCIEPSLGSKEFFLRKAIGWALRQYAWTDPKEVVRYVREHAAELASLSRREALKNVTALTNGGPNRIS